MTHLTESELLDAADGRLDADRQRHAAGCVGCARQLDDLRAVLTHAAEVDVPEPSPLFWDHLSARIREDIAHEAPGRWARWALPSGLRPWPAAAVAAVAAIALVATVTVFRSSSNDPTTGPDRQRGAEAQTAMVSPADNDPVTDDVDGDEAWAVVREVADEVVWDDLTEAAISARPGSAERAVQTLTAAERSELAALIAEELKRSGA
jgi:hypothetical protein